MANDAQNPPSTLLDTHPVTPSLTIDPASKAATHKALAFAALRLDSSLSVRLKRYNRHMAKARAMEPAGGAQ